MIPLKRFVILFAVWLILTAADPGGLAVGAAIATGGAWLSLRLLPPEGRTVSLPGLIGLAPRFLWRSVLGGVDVAWRAVHPRMPLKTGWLVHETRLPAGMPRVMLGNEFSLLPGTLVAGSLDGRLFVHCLDTEADIAGQIREEEARIDRVMGRVESDGGGEGENAGDRGAVR